jgi:hypothetical protein
MAEGNDLVAAAVHHQHGGPDRGDAAPVVVAVAGQQAYREERVDLCPQVRDRGEGRLENDPCRLDPRRQFQGDRRPQGAPEEQDLSWGQAAFSGQPAPGGGRIAVGARLRGAALAQAIARLRLFALEFLQFRAILAPTGMASD